MSVIQMLFPDVGDGDAEMKVTLSSYFSFIITFDAFAFPIFVTVIV